MTNKYHLDYFEKAVLSNQYRILQLLAPLFNKKSGGIYEANKYKNYIEILDSNLVELFPEIFEGNFELPHDIQRDVLAITELYELMEISYGYLSLDEQREIDGDKIVFNGFGSEDKYYTEIRDFLTALNNSEVFEDRPGVSVVTEDMLEFPPVGPMMPLYKQQLGRLEALKARPGYVGSMLTMEELKYLTEGFEDAPPLQ
ncbi:YfbU family protein [Zooshikella ganghwensis]|uniref:Uncharacterized protein n=1 Tax=Zooshikella ganghwensis TaxID=202772 RepID=A0A4P9VTB4_9GAMM|nr:YfbU family protein [Zooshikella ganghwensis]RDH46406.1 hypothetical protein B9G39_24770 [Zooshikella ganghwensis]